MKPHKKHSMVRVDLTGKEQCHRDRAVRSSDMWGKRIQTEEAAIARLRDLGSA